MEFTVQSIDGLCARLDRLAEQLVNVGGLADTRHENLVNEVVQVVQRIGEGIAWAYGQRQKSGLGELFAQPFVDRRTRDRLKALLCESTPLTSRTQCRAEQLRNRVAAQILQTIHILLQATPAESTLFCNLNAGWYLNDVVATPFDFRDNEDFLPLWMTVVKDVAAMLNTDNLMLFFDPSSRKPFPLFTEAARFYHHPTAQIRTHVQAISLDVFLKLRDQSVWAEPLFAHVVGHSSVFFTHVSCLLREFWLMVDEGMRHSGSRREVRSALSIQNDILVYLGDVLSCEVPQLTAVLQEKLLRFAVLPILVRSVLRGEGGAQTAPGLAFAPSTAAYLLDDVVSTLRGSSIPLVVASTLLRAQVPEELVVAVSAPPLRTPVQYFENQTLWNGESGGSPSGPFFDGVPALSDDTLYAMPTFPLAKLLESPMRPLVQNKLLDVLVSELMALASQSAGPRASRGRGTSLLATTKLALRTCRDIGEVLANNVAERLCATIASVLLAHGRLGWATSKAALGVLQEVVAATDSPPGRSLAVIGSILRESVVRPLAAELLRELRQVQEHKVSREMLLQEFEEQWHAHLVTPPEGTVESQQRDFLEAGEQTGAVPEGRARCLRILLSVWRFVGGSFQEQMPGIDEIEADEIKRFQVGSSIHVGKMNRVKCHLRCGGRQSHEAEALYLMPAQTSVLLVRPDDQKPFWAVTVIAESLRTARLELEDENSGPIDKSSSPVLTRDEQQRPLRYELRMEVTDPRSTILKKISTAPTVSPSRPSGVAGLGSGYPNHSDRLATTISEGPSRSVSGLPGGGDRLAHSLPIGKHLEGRGATDVKKQHSVTSCSFSLLFTDERRRRVASKVLAQARNAVQARAVEAVVAFLRRLEDGA
eukprot:TRINITY_DN9603_c0_g2_i4.p1 TRINITY_DN9603_c0_g2~~TRINITY_DN9603_c0_g2_i4.p1  ORF type:complete len:877 (+),score=129.74 TRINITY_DN9603_c0_g2_i4:70-2700(+)